MCLVTSFNSAVVLAMESKHNEITMAVSCTMWLGFNSNKFHLVIAEFLGTCRLVGKWDYAIVITPCLS